MYIKKITIDNFLSYRSKETIEIDNNKLIIVGENGSGKSNIVRTLEFIVGKFILSSYVNWEEEPYWDRGKDMLISITATLNDSDRKLLFDVLLFQLLSLNQNKEAVDFLKYYLAISDLLNQFTSLFSKIEFGLSTDPKNPERLKLFLSTILDDDLILFTTDTDASEIFIDSKPENELFLSSYSLNNDYQYHRLKAISELIDRVNNDDMEYSQDSLKALFLDMFTNGNQIQIENINFSNLERLRNLRSEVNSLKTQLKDRFGNLRDNYRLNFMSVFGSILQDRIIVLREDRGLLGNSENPAVLTLDRIQYNLFDKKFSPSLYEQEKYSKIKKKFKEYFPKLNFELVLKKSEINFDSQTQLIVGPETRNSYQQDTTYRIFSKTKKPITARVPILQFNENNFAFTIESAPGGAYEAIMVLDALHGYNATTIILDEPGKTLHPSLRKQLRNHIESKTNLTKIMITHTSELLSEKSLDNIIRITKSTEGSKISNLIELFNNGTDQKLRSTIIDPIFSQIFFSRGVIFVEGKFDNLLLQALEYIFENQLLEGEVVKIKKLISILNYNWTIIYLGGKYNIQKAIKIAQHLKLKWILLTDFDAFKKAGKNPDDLLIESSVLGNVFHDDLFPHDKKCPFHIKNSEIENNKEELLAFAEEFHIFSWKGDLEDSVKLTLPDFKKSDWTNINFLDRVEMSKQLILEENEEILRFLDFCLSQDGLFNFVANYRALSEQGLGGSTYT